MGLLERDDRPGLRPEPRVVAFGPGLLGRRKATPMAEEEFREPVTAAEQVGANVFATPQQIAGGFFLLRRNVNGGERAGAIQHGKLACIAAVSLDAIAGPPRNQRGRDHIAWHVVSGECPLQFEATRAGFVAAGARSLALDARDEAQNR